MAHRLMNVIHANWPAPKHVHALTTTRSLGNFKQLEDRVQIKTLCQLPSEPVWLQQIHSAKVVNADETITSPADAAYSRSHKVLAIMTADCLPVLICNQQGTEIAAIHAGWRGLQAGIISNTVKQLASDPAELLLWFGPAIGPKHFEVGPEVYDAFVSNNQQFTAGFTPHNDRWLANIFKLAAIECNALGIQHISGGDYCTYSDATQFFSYRRDGEIAGRLVSLIWFS